MKLALSETLEALLAEKAKLLGISAQDALRMLAVQWVSGGTLPVPFSAPAPSASSLERVPNGTRVVPLRDPVGTLEGPGGGGKGVGVFAVAVSSPPEEQVRQKSRKSRTEDDSDPAFLAFWDAYPKKKSKGDARKAWRDTARLRPPLEQILRCIAAERTGADWQKNQGQFIPHPASWLRSEGWANCAEILPFEIPADPEIDWRIAEVWADHVYAYRSFLTASQGAAPEVDPVLTADLRAAIETALRTYDGGLLGPLQRQEWEERSITRAAGVGQFYSEFHIGKDPRAPGVMHLGHELPWRNGNTQRFADQHFALGAAKRKAAGR